MKKQTYSDQLKSPLWQKKRLEILSRDKFKCKLCGDEETQLHVHHKEYIDGNKAWEYPKENFITVCNDCHKVIHEIESRNDFINYSDIKILKLSNWSKGGVLMFAKHLDLTFIYSFDDKGKIECAYAMRELYSRLIKKFYNSLKF